MKKAITKTEFLRIRELKRRADVLNLLLHQIVDEAAKICGERPSEIPNGLMFNYIHNSSPDELRHDLRLHGIAARFRA